MSLSPFWNILPEKFQELQWLHTSVRRGDYGTMSLQEAEAAYLQALMNEDWSVFSQEIQKLMDNNSITVNTALAYIQGEFSDYQQCMQAQFSLHSGLCKDFTDENESQKIIQRLSRPWLDYIEIEVFYGRNTETISIPELDSLGIRERYYKFWEAMSQVLRRKNRDGHATAEIQAINFNF